MKATKPYTNVLHHIPVAYETLPDLLCSADLHILFQKNDVIDTVMPSKLLGMMASAKPSLVTGNSASEIAQVFKISKGGYFYDSNAFDKVIHTIEKLCNNRSENISIGKNARRYIIKHYASEKVLHHFESKIQEVIHR